MPKLNDTQLMLLAHGAQQDNSLYPLPASLMKDGAIIARAIKAVGQLTGYGLIEERETGARDQISRTDGDLNYGMFVTAAGLAAIGVHDASDPQEELGAHGGVGAQEGADAGTGSPAPAVTVARTTKATMVLGLLQRADGATMDELIAATGWLPHTTRAALTGLRKKGHTIDKGKRGEVTCYRVVAAA